MIFSHKAIESFKIALAITLAMGISVSMDWDQPRWAAINIALASLATVGLTLNNAIERILGTITAGLMTLLLVALFGQDRWLYLLALSVWMGACTYLMGGKKFEGFWMLAGFATAIIATDAGINMETSAESFEAVMLRLQQTLLGLLCYIVVVVLVLPSDGFAAFKRANITLHETQQKLFQTYLDVLRGRTPDGATGELRLQAVQQQAQFLLMLEGVQKERYEVWEIRDKWECYRDQLVALGETMAFWRESFIEAQTLDLDRLLPQLRDYTDELDARLTQVAGMLKDQPPAASPRTIELKPDENELNKLSAFDKAAFSLSLHHLQALEPVTRTMFNVLADIKDFAADAATVGEAQAARKTLLTVPDVDRLLGAFRVMLTLWMSYLLLIYFNPLPGGSNLVSMGAASAMAIALLPHLPIRMFMPALTGFGLLSALVFFFVLPSLSSYWGLGALIFAGSFWICYRYFEPQQMLFKGLAIVLFLTLIDINNEQAYDFIRVAETSVMFYLIALILAFNSYIPFSPRPEDAFVRLLKRFFRCAAYLMSTLQRDPQEKVTRWDAQKEAFCANELAMVPEKLMMWSGFLRKDSLGGTTLKDVQALTLQLQVLGYRLRELLAARSDVNGERLVSELSAHELRDSIQAAQERVQASFQSLAEDPTKGDSRALGTAIANSVEELEQQIRQTFGSLQELPSRQEGAHLYRLLGSYRAVSEATHDYTGSADNVNWTRWQEARF